MEYTHVVPKRWLLIKKLRLIKLQNFYTARQPRWNPSVAESRNCLRFMVRAYNRVYKSPPLVCHMSQIKPVHALTIYLGNFFCFCFFLSHSDMYRLMNLSVCFLSVAYLTWILSGIALVSITDRGKRFFSCKALGHSLRKPTLLFNGKRRLPVP